MSPTLLMSGPGDGSHIFVVAHGDGSPMDGERMSEFAAGLGARAIDVVRFEFPYMQARRLGGRPVAPDNDAVLDECFREVVGGLAHTGRLVVGGWSRGGRSAVRIASEQHVVGLVCLSYPFHPIGEPTRLDALDHLRATEVPTLIVQGTRDAHGNREQVRGYRLAARLRVHWLEDANHLMQPRVRSEFSAAEHLQSAIAEVARFILAC